MSDVGGWTPRHDASWRPSQCRYLVAVSRINLTLRLFCFSTFPPLNKSRGFHLGKNQCLGPWLESNFQDVSQEAQKMERNSSCTVCLTFIFFFR
jgi:hypothetical protein